MSVRLNLLPDLRQQRLKDKQRRQTVTAVAIGVCVVAGGITILLALYDGALKINVAQLSSKIKDKQSQLTSITNLIPALTAQQNLAALPGLYKQRVYYTKFFTAYDQVAPNDITLGNLGVDANNQLKVSGVASSYTSVAKLAEAMAANKVSLDGGAAKPYFGNVQILDTSRGSGTQVTFNITATVAGGSPNGN